MTAPTPPAAQVDAEVRRMFGDVAGFLAEPELGPILRQAAGEGWEGPRLFGALQQTKFWKTKADDERKFVMLSALDPATARMMVDARASDLRQLATSLGVPVQPDTLRQVAQASVRLGWNQNQMRESVTAGFTYTPGVGGQAGQSATEIRKLANDYLVPLSDQALSDWTRQIVQGTTDIDGFKSYVQEQAKSLFPAMAGAIDRGISVAQYVDPYKQVAARELELSPDQIDLTEPRFRKMFDKVDDKGNRTAMTLSESAEYLRTQPEWRKTRGANERAAAMTESILRNFGKV